MSNEQIYQRSGILLGEENIAKLKSMNVLICGIGGVGSFTLEALARIGIGNITIVDKDTVDITNINRQIIALSTNIGQSKVDVAVKRVSEINNDIKVSAICKEIQSSNITEIINQKYDYIVDCVDNIDAKVAIIQYSNSNNMKCISCMGMGNKLNPLDIKVSDIYSTNTCPLAKIIRKRLKEIKIEKQKVVFSVEIPKEKSEQEKERYGNTLGSVSFVPSVAGLVIASEVVKDLLKE